MNKLLYPCIIVPAFKRTASLRLLLKSLSQANYPSLISVPLIISIDKSTNLEVRKIAEEFHWLNGKKEIINHKENLGLKKHILYCGNLTKKYNSVIILEDDLYVSPDFYHYSVKAINHFYNDSKVAGIALYHSNYSEIRNMNFYPLYEGFQNYFHQLPCSWGQVWTMGQWTHFVENYQSAIDQIIPFKASTWPDDSSWKKDFFKYMVAYDKYFVYPHYSLTTNFGAPGQHYNTSTSLLQTPLNIGRNTDFSFIDYQHSNSIYDAWGEILPRILKKLNPVLNKYDFACDLSGNKNLAEVNNEYIISIRECNHSIIGYENALIPPELNIINSINGTFFNLGLKVNFNPVPAWEKIELLSEHYTKINISGIRKGIELKYTSNLAYRLCVLSLKPFRYLKKLIFKVF